MTRPGDRVSRCKSGDYIDKVAIDCIRAYADDKAESGFKSRLSHKGT